MSISKIIRDLLEKEEGDHFEVKRVSGKMVAKALEAICSFTNADGGLLVIGMEDPDKGKGIDRLYGISENPIAVDELKQNIGTHFLPPITVPKNVEIKVQNREGKIDAVVLFIIEPGKKVHTLLDSGTWTRQGRKKRHMTAAEIAELSYKRGVISAESETVDLDIDLLNTETFDQYCAERRLVRGNHEQKFEAIGLAKRQDNKLRPTKAAVLLFANYPSDLLAFSGTRASVRVFHYSGTAIDRSEHPNLQKPPRTITGPLYDLIRKTTDYVIEEITVGFEMGSGFVAKHRYPERVIKEAITNAVIHRDYRYPKDIQIRIFNDRIEVESPGEFPANITPATIETAGSAPRNPSLVNHLREFAAPPNVDAGEGVPMMFSEMKKRGLYPPNYSVRRQAIPTVLVRLLNEERPAAWEQVNAFLDRKGAITNRDLREIAGVDTLRASRLLKSWVDKGLLVMHGSGKKNTSYRKVPAMEGDLFALVSELKAEIAAPTQSENAHELELDKYALGAAKFVKNPPAQLSKNTKRPRKS